MATAYVITNDSKVAYFIEDVEKIEGNRIVGSHGEASGIDLAKAKIIVVDEFIDLDQGDTFPSDYTDVSDQFIRKPDSERIKELELQLAASEADKTAMQLALAELAELIAGGGGEEKSG